MSLTYHTNPDNVATFGEDSKQVTKSKLNANFATCISNDALALEYLEDTLHALFSSGTLAGMIPSFSTGLALTVSSGSALIGREITWVGGTVTLLANANPGYVYFCADCTWYVSTTPTPPDNKSSYLYATYVSDATNIVSLTQCNKLVLPQLVILNDVIDIPVVDAYSDYYIDHTALGSLAIQGFLTLKLSPSNAFYVKHINSGGITTDSDTLTSPPEEDTPTGFWIRIVRKEGYSYGDNPIATLSWTRTGLSV